MPGESPGCRVRGSSDEGAPVGEGPRQRAGARVAGGAGGRGPLDGPVRAPAEPAELVDDDEGKCVLCLVAYGTQVADAQPNVSSWR